MLAGEGNAAAGGLRSCLSHRVPSQLVDMVMNLGEYQTFSMMMRMKVQQKRVMKLLMDATNNTGLLSRLGIASNDEDGNNNAPQSAESKEVNYYNNTKKIEGKFGIGKPYVGITGKVLVAEYNIIPTGDLRYTWEEIKLEKLINIKVE